MILVMGVGIGATTGVFGLLDRLVLKGLPVHEPGRLVFLRNPAVSYPIFSEVRTRGWNASTSCCAQCGAAASVAGDSGGDTDRIHQSAPWNQSFALSSRTSWWLGRLLSGFISSRNVRSE
jgi:hypothetical protein